MNFHYAVNMYTYFFIHTRLLLKESNQHRFKIHSNKKKKKYVCNNCTKHICIALHCIHGFVRYLVIVFRFFFYSIAYKLIAVNSYLRCLSLQWQLFYNLTQHSFWFFLFILFFVSKNIIKCFLQECDMLVLLFFFSSF